MKKKNDHLRWQVLNRKLIFDSPIFRVFCSQRCLPEYGREEKRGEFYYFDTKDWVTIIPLIKSGVGYDVILVEQFRHGSEKIVMEFPAGVVEANEEPSQCALREMLEETGYEEALRCEQIGLSYPNPAIMSNRTYTYCALLKEDSQPKALCLDELESLQVHRIKLRELRQLIFSKNSAFNSALMLQSMFWLENSEFFASLE